MDTNSAKIGNVLTLFFLSTALNHEAFFINIGSFSVRPYMVAMAFGLVWLMRRRCSTFVNKNQKNIISFLYLFFMMAALTVVYSPYVSAAPIMYVRNLILLTIQFATFLFLFITYNYTDRDILARSIKSTLSLMLIVAYVLYLYHISTKGFINYNMRYIGVVYTYLGQARMIGTVGDPNYFALYISMYFWLHIYLAKEALRKNKLIVILFIGAILLSQSRNAMLINGLSLFVFSIVEKKRLSLSSVLLLLGIVPAFYLLNEYVLDLGNLLNLSQDASFNHRFRLLAEGLNNIYRYPFGVGIGYMPQYYSEFMHESSVAHNDFLSVFVETGILGVALYSLLYLITFVHTNTHGKLLILTLVGYSFGLTMYYFDPVIPIVFATLLTKYHKEEFSYTN